MGADGCRVIYGYKHKKGSRGLDWQWFSWTGVTHTSVYGWAKILLMFNNTFVTGSFALIELK